MKPEEIHFLDWKRWLFGEGPPEFMIEVAIRTAVIYLILILAVRIMGKRMKGQITLTELAVMVTLGAIVSPVMQLPDRGLLFAVIVLCVTILFQRGVTMLEFRNRKFEKVSQGEMSMLVKDGSLVLEELNKTDISRQQLYAMLREKKIDNLGKVKRAYLEACGILTVYQTQEEKAGLSIFPPSDPELQHMLPAVDHGMMACCNCGHVQQVADEAISCDTCGESEWSIAYLAVNK